MENTAKKKKKMKKRSRPPMAPCNGATNDKRREQQLHRQEQEQHERGTILDSLVEAFDSVSLEEVASAYEQAGGNPNKAAEILSCLVDGDAKSEGQAPSTSGSSSSSGSDFKETGCVQTVVSGRSKQPKRVVAATGMVSTVLGKDYTRRSPGKHSKTRAMKDYRGVLDKEVAEQFLCSMLGDEGDLSMAVVRDVLCHCGYNVEKALDVLLRLSASSCEQSGNGNDNLSDKQDPGLLIEQFENMTDWGSECISHPPEYDFQDSIWSLGYDSRDYSKVLNCSEAVSPTSPTSNLSDLPQKVLESLFNMSKSPEHEPGTMNWRSVVKKMQSLVPWFDVCTSRVSEPQQGSYAEGDEYHVFRKTAKEHWASMRSCYQKAAEAHLKGKLEYAAYLSDQGKIQAKLARAADEKASQDIFKARNEGIENVITIDLHGQPLKQAMRLLKLHLLLGNYVPSNQTLRVINRCGSHGVGKSELKQSVIELLEVEGIEWREENGGTLLIKLDGYREFSSLDIESDTEDYSKVLNCSEAVSPTSPTSNLSDLPQKVLESLFNIQAADEKASQDMFKARNKGIENVITIDLHGQHVKQAMRLSKLHLLFGNYLPSVQTLRVITGCMSRGVGKSKLKQSVIKLLEVEGIEWREENRGTLLINLDGYREFSFQDIESDTE